MTNQLTITGANEIDAQRVRLTSLVATLYGSVEWNRGYYELPKPLSVSTRRELENYQQALHARLRPISMAQAEKLTVRKALATLLQGYLNAKGDFTAILDAYVGLLQDQPQWAILAALDDFRNHRVFDLNAEGDRVYFTVDHAPSAPRVLDQAKKIADAYREEWGKIDRLLKITRVKPQDRQISTEEAARVREGILALSQRLSSGIVRDRTEEQAKRRAEIEAANARTARIMEEARRRNADAEGASQEASIHG